MVYFGASNKIPVKYKKKLCSTTWKSPMTSDRCLDDIVPSNLVNLIPKNENNEKNINKCTILSTLMQFYHSRPHFWL